MNKWQKVGLAAGMGTAVIATTHIINKFIFKYATINNYTFENKSENSYGWKFGNIAYSAYGDKNASPLLLIHDLNAYSSGYEWNNVIQHLSDTHYVYVLDMLGLTPCVFSIDKSLKYGLFHSFFINSPLSIN